MNDFDNSDLLNKINSGNYRLCAGFDNGCPISNSDRYFCNGDGIIKHYSHPKISEFCSRFDPVDDVALSPKGNKGRKLKSQADELLRANGFDPNKVA